jgi:hypothetical protein
MLNKIAVNLLYIKNRYHVINRENSRKIKIFEAKQKEPERAEGYNISIRDHNRRTIKEIVTSSLTLI